MYAIVDIETTGSSAAHGKITEIAIIIHDGKRVVDEYQTLLNPEQHIPSNITALTGIDNEMVADAPRFYEVAKDIHLLLEGHIFVAHNVNFDYSFIKKEFQELGANFSMPKLCTVRLSRKVFPGLKSYSLGRLCDHFGIKNEARHRAMGDARATAILMDKILANEKGEIDFFLKKTSKEADLPPNLDRESFEVLPETTGVYYFHDHHGKVLYVGKANNIKKRVRTHFSSTDVIYKQQLKDKIRQVSYEVCGDELIAFLKESYEIKRLFPPFNKAQKFPTPKFGMYHYTDGAGINRLAIGKVQKGLQPVQTFPSFDKARSFLIQFVKTHGLQPEHCGLPESLLNYYGYSFDEASENELKERFQRALSSLMVSRESYCILGKGRDREEVAVVLVEEGRYLGFGFAETQFSFETISDVKSVIQRYPDTPDVQSIIRQFREKRKVISL
ncbi:exonuclease domain-containing protein [Roseivirga thermotolerans]|jgi:DNA polymerase-3 subunit epsilon|uniref:Exonuclease n=1 Tax=Roseivirga thermotolerans TaxID=1758176 RepID=A0ABQ3I8W2_9BACT|nr:exonuclease domain-containing protein [Roseivirga thermotolerans]GHE72670.1 exonuclease [Roseivirga thermotolerans]